MMSGCTHLFPLTDHHPSTFPKCRQPSPTQQQIKARLSQPWSKRSHRQTSLPFCLPQHKKASTSHRLEILLRNSHFTTSYRAASRLSHSRQTSTSMNRPGRTHPHDLILLQPSNPALQAKFANICLPSCLRGTAAPRERCAPVYAFTSSMAPLATFNPSADLNDPVNVPSGRPNGPENGSGSARGY